MTLIDLLRPKPSKPFYLHFYEGFRLVNSLTPQEIDEGSHQVALALIERGHIQKPVVLSLPNCAEFVVCFFGILKAQCIPVPVASPSYMSEYSFRQLKQHLEGILGDCLWISQEGDGVCPRDLLTKSLGALPTAIPSDTALIQFSSGSTHEPKGVVLTHSQVLTNIEQIKQGMQVTSKDVLSSWLPFYHDMGLIGGVLSALYNQVESHFMSPADFLASPTRWLKTVASTKTSIIMGPNLLYRHLLRRVKKPVLENLDLTSVRLALCGAEPVQFKLLKQAAEYLSTSGFRKNALFPVYGMAENCLAVSFPDCGQELKVEKFGDSELASCGKALNGIEIRIIDEKGDAVGEGRLGEIQFRSPSMTKGYYKNSKATAALFVNGWLRTGDLGILKDGEIYIAGRSKEVIILNGKKYFPQELEERVGLLQDSKVGRSLAFQVFGEAGYRIAVETKEWRPWRRKEMRQQISEILQKWTWETPSQIHLVAPCTLPRTSSGKLQRTLMKSQKMVGWISGHERTYFMRLSQSYWQRIKIIRRYMFSKTRPALRTNQIEDLVKVTFAEVMQIPAGSINMKKSFFSYNMESVHVVQLNVLLQKKMSCQGRPSEISLHDFIQLRDLQELCQYLKEKGYAPLAAKEGTYDQQSGTRSISQSGNAEVEISF
jgi:acyl-CoA synthetase (AMP-forming)/AMP-acid ligase II/acyl carrier protein